QLPVNWNNVSVNNVAAGDIRYHLSLERSGGLETIRIRANGVGQEGSNGGPRRGMRLTVAPAFPLDAIIRSVTIGGRETPFKVTRIGDVQRAEVIFDFSQETTIVYNYDEGTEVYAEMRAPAPGAINQGLRILRSRADANSLRLTLEGLGAREYRMRVRTPRILGAAAGVKQVEGGGQDAQVVVTFDGPRDAYVRREVMIPLMARK